MKAYIEYAKKFEPKIEEIKAIKKETENNN
jgi:hypothetical protein